MRWQSRLEAARKLENTLNVRTIFVPILGELLRRLLKRVLTGSGNSKCLWVNLLGQCWLKGFLRLKRFWKSSGENALSNTSMMVNVFKLTNRGTRLRFFHVDLKTFQISIQTRLNCSESM